MVVKLWLKEMIAGIVKDKFGVEIEAPINYPEQKQFGDYATPVAMGLAKQLGQINISIELKQYLADLLDLGPGEELNIPLRLKPRDVAEIIAAALRERSEFSKVEVAGPGFVNVTLSDRFLNDLVNGIASDEDFGRNDAFGGKKILLEFVSANPTGPLHIGHGRWAAIGDSMARVMKFCGADVATEFYVNDAGNQIRLLRASVDAVRHGEDVPENGYHGDYVKDVAAAMKDGDDPAKILLAEQQKTLSAFRVGFDNYFSETSLHESGAVKDTIEMFAAKGATYEQDGATFLATTRYGDDKDRALVKADGDYTYFAADIAYHRNKVERGFAELVNVLGADHHGYVARITAAVKLMDPDVEMRVIIGQLVNLFRDGEPVRMSKRTGDMIELQEVMDEIGIDAARYYLVMRKTDSHLDFDLTQAKEQSDDNPVFYVQYATARIAGILRNAAEQGITAEADGAVDCPVDCGDARDVALELAKFPETLVAIASDLEPHRIPAYLENLSTVFHRYYHHNRVLGEDAAVTARRLRLIHAVRNVLKTGLGLIGVSAPERM